MMKFTKKALFLSIVFMMTMASLLVASEKKSELANGVYAEMMTNKGLILLQLEYEKTPLTVTNFVGLSEGKIKNNAKAVGTPYYNGLKFHRVIPNFMVQGGDPQGTGRGGPGYKFADEFDSSLTHTGGGILSMANSGPKTNGSQFFITHISTPWLNGKHTVFGHVVMGMDVVNSIKGNDKIISVVIKRIGEKAKKFIADQAHFDALVKASENKGTKKSAGMLDIVKARWPKAIKTSSGLHYVVTKPASGKEKPMRGMTVTAHYTGKLMNGKKFDSSVDRGTPFKFPVGRSRVIKGWDEAFLDMGRGEKRTLIIPPHLGYGSRGAGGVITGNAWLIFDVELLDFK